MRYLALACAYDETIAQDDHVEPATAAALRRLVASGRQLILVTRRPLDLLGETIPAGLFEWIIAEYGGVLHRPSTRETHLLADRLPERLMRRAAAEELGPVRAGAVTLFAGKGHQAAVRNLLEAEDVDLAVVADKDMALAVPAGVGKARGLMAVLAELGLSPHNVVGCGDAETDLEMLASCAYSVAVANAPASVRERCELVTKGAAGAGVVELIDRLIRDELDLEQDLARHGLLLGTHVGADGEPEEGGAGERRDGELRVPAYGTNLLLAGSSGTGKSTLARGLLERLGGVRPRREAADGQFPAGVQPRGTDQHRPAPGPLLPHAPPPGSAITGDVGRLARVLDLDEVPPAIGLAAVEVGEPVDLGELPAG
jgi:hydroxymethylpyrimidine pyrophosphatase-like HAD family hydrolase